MSAFKIQATLIALLAVHPALAAEDEHADHHPVTAAAPTAVQSGDAAAGMKKMQEQMAAIRASTDPKERARLMEEHMQTMQSTMQQMRDHNGCMMMGKGMQDGAGGGMNMMQMMMDQMMQHQKAIQGMGR